MEFKVGQAVAIISTPKHVGIVVEIGLQGWLGVKFGKRTRWMHSDALREEFGAFISIPVPEGVVVMAKPGGEPVVFQQADCPDSRFDQIEIFAEAIWRMWRSKLAA